MKPDRRRSHKRPFARSMLRQLAAETGKIYEESAFSALPRCRLTPQRPETQALQRVKTILIIEDDRVIAATYKKRFLDAGYGVEWAPDGLEGVKMVTAIKPTVILLDLLMPRLDGIEVLKFIRGHPEVRHLPVVVFSNSYMTNLVEAAWRAGADQCLMKASTTPAQLFDAVNKAITKAATRKATAMPSGNTATGILNPLLRPDAPVIAPAPVTARSAPVIQPEPSPVVAAPALAVPASTGNTGIVERSVIQASADPEFQAQIRQLFLSTSGPKLASIRNLATSCLQDGSATPQSTLFTELFRKIHSMVGNAALAGCDAIAHFASQFEALLQELLHQPDFINVSTRRSIGQAVDHLELHFRSANRADAGMPAETNALILEPVTGVAHGLTQALTLADLKTEVSHDPAEALGLMASGPFGLVVLPVNLQGLSGFELAAQMKTLPGHTHTPMLFITSLEHFSSHSSPQLLGDNDIVARPYLPIELILKAVAMVQRPHLDWTPGRAAAA